MSIGGETFLSPTGRGDILVARRRRFPIARQEGRFLVAFLSVFPCDSAYEKRTGGTAVPANPLHGGWKPPLHAVGQANVNEKS